MSSLYKDIVHRTELVLGTDTVKKLSQIKVLIVGVGGVGSWCAEALARSGVIHVTVVDSDIICPTNLNRQAQTHSGNLGKHKASEMRDKLLLINPYGDFCSVENVFNADTADQFALSDYDYVIDAIDSIQSKVLLLQLCAEKNITVFSSMGAGAKSDPSKIRTGKISKTEYCPLARAVRLGLRKKNVTKEILCVYSEEASVEPAVKTLCGTGDCGCCHARDSYNEKDNNGAVDFCAHKKRINGALVHITGIFGLTLAGLVINDTAAKAKEDQPLT